MKRNKGKVVLANAIDIVSCSMYSGFKEVFNGFSKNFYSGFSENILIFIFFLLHVFTAYIIPPILVLIGYLSEDQSLMIWGIVLTVLGMLIRLVLPTDKPFCETDMFCMCLDRTYNLSRFVYTLAGKYQSIPFAALIALNAPCETTPDDPTVFAVAQ